MACVQAATPTHLLCTTITTMRPTFSVGTAGGTSATYANNLVDIAARVQPRSGFEGVQNGREVGRHMVVIYVAGTHDILEKDRVIHGGKTYDVTAVTDFQGAQVLKRLDCEEPKP